MMYIPDLDRWLIKWDHLSQLTDEEAKYRADIQRIQKQFEAELMEQYLQLGAK